MNNTGHSTDAPAATDGWPGYTPDDLAWFAANYADTEWAVHVIGPDDVHTNEPDAQGEHNPDGKPLTEQSAWALADSIHRFNAWYRAKFGEKPGYTEDLIPNVFHRGVLVEKRPEPPPGQPEVLASRVFRIGGLVEITGRGDVYDGKTGVVTEIDDNPEYPIGVAVEGWVGLVWCGATEIRHAAAAPTETAADRLQALIDQAAQDGEISDDTPLFDVAGYTATFGDLREVLATAMLAARLMDGLERVQSRVSGLLHFDANETPPPDDERWAQSLYELNEFVTEAYFELENAYAAAQGDPHALRATGDAR